MRLMDGLRALIGGLGEIGRDKSAGAYYSAPTFTDENLLNAYRSSALAAKIVDIPAMDAIRKGRNWQAENDQIEAIEAEEQRLGFWPKLLEAQRSARLWGGAAVFVVTRDIDMAEPLAPERIGRGGIDGLMVFSRRELAAEELEDDPLSPLYGRPRMYAVNSRTRLRLHPSRLAVFCGPKAPDPWINAGMAGWGDSVLTAAMAALHNVDATSANIGSLVYEANVDIIGIPDFTESIEDERFRNAVIQRSILAAANKGNNRTLLMDAGETYNRKQISFATLPEVLQEFEVLLAASADIPATRLFGRSPAGMNATGQSDMKNYYDRLQSMQEFEFRPAIHVLDECLIRSALGARPPEIHYIWSPLEQMNERERADIDKLNAETADLYYQNGLVPMEALAKVVQNRLIEDAVYPGLEAAIAELPEMPAEDPAAAETPMRAEIEEPADG